MTDKVNAPEAESKPKGRVKKKSKGPKSKPNKSANKVSKKPQLIRSDVVTRSRKDGKGTNKEAEENVKKGDGVGT